MTEDKNNEQIKIKNTALLLSFASATMGIAGVFAYFGLYSLLYPLVIAAAAVFSVNIALRSIRDTILLRIKTGIQKYFTVITESLIYFITAILAVSIIIYISQDQMLFYYIDDAESRGFLWSIPGYHEVEFTSTNGKTYNGVIYKQTEEKAPLIIYFGGNGECSYRHMRNRYVNDGWEYYEGYNYLYVDYEGYGINEGKTNYLNMYEQALAVYDFAAAQKYVDEQNIVVMGYSLGTGNAVYLAANRNVAGLILVAPYANGKDFYNNLLPVFYGPMELLIKQKLPSDEYAENVSCPTLVIASLGDEMVPYESSERLYRLFSENTEFMRLENESHNNIFRNKDFPVRIKSFLDRVDALYKGDG